MKYTIPENGCWEGEKDEEHGSYRMVLKGPSTAEIALTILSDKESTNLTYLVSATGIKDETGQHVPIFGRYDSSTQSRKWSENNAPLKSWLETALSREGLPEKICGRNVREDIRKFLAS